MQTPIAIYIASLLGAVGLILMMPKARHNYRLVGALVAAAGLGWLWLFLGRRLPGEELGITGTAFGYHYVFGLIAIAAAVRVITHTRPVYAALWFVLVVLASAGLLLTLAAEFMAFAMIIIYGGAILVTYMFVIMLATQSGSGESAAGVAGAGDDDPQTSPYYDRIAREPVAAVAAGFLLIAVLLLASSEPVLKVEQAFGDSDAWLIEHIVTERPRLEVDLVSDALPAGREMHAAALGVGQELSNVERVGIDLFRSHPLGLEMAGVILLVALIGAVVIAKTRVEEEEQRIEPAGDASGASVHQRREPGPDDPSSYGQSGGRTGA